MKLSKFKNCGPKSAHMTLTTGYRRWPGTSSKMWLWEEGARLLLRVSAGKKPQSPLNAVLPAAGSLKPGAPEFTTGETI